MSSIKQRYPQKPRKKKIKSKRRVRMYSLLKLSWGEFQNRIWSFYKIHHSHYSHFQVKCKLDASSFLKTLYYVSHRPELSKQIRSLILVCIYTFKNSYYWLCWMPWLLENHYSSRDSFLFGIVSIWSPECHDLNADSRYACVKWYGE